MAPEEILSSADASRRDFLKKVLAGTTFAVPVVASFSMEGLSPESASAGFVSNCSNMSTSQCCRFAAELTIAIAQIGSFCIVGLGFGGPEAQALLLGQLGKVQTAMAEGLDKGKGDCTSKKAQGEFKKAAKELEKFKELVDRLCGGETADLLNQDADALIGAITDLLNGTCSSFPALVTCSPT